MNAWHTGHHWGGKDTLPVGKSAIKSTFVLGTVVTWTSPARVLTLPQIPRASLAFTTEPVGNGGFKHGEWASLSLDVDIQVTVALKQAGRGRHPQLLIIGPLGGIVESRI